MAKRRKGCQVLNIDGTVVRVNGGKKNLTDRDIAALRGIVAAVKKQCAEPKKDKGA